MKILSLLLISVFALSAFDIPFETLQGSQKGSCCCKAGTICRCQSSGVGMCPMKRMKESQAAGKSHCELQRAKALKHAVKQALETAKAAGAPIFKAFGCGSAEEHKAAPTYSRDFIFEPHAQGANRQAAQVFFKAEFRHPLPQIFYTIEKPPQISLLSI